MRNKLILSGFHKAFILTLIMSVVAFVSCRKDFSPSWESSLLIPLIKTELSINDVITDSLIAVNHDQSLSLVYRNNIYSFSIDSIIQFPDTITNSFYNIPFTINAQPGQTLINTNDVKKLKFGSASITLAQIRSGFVVFKALNTLKEAVVCSYKIPSATRNGIPFELNELIPPAANAADLYIRKIDISGYDLDLRGPNGTSHNRISTIIQAKIDPNGNPVQITPADMLRIDVNFEDLQFNYAKGYFGNSSHSFGPDTNAFKLFTKISEGSIDLESVKAILTIENSFGIDASVMFNSLTAINSLNNQSLSLASPLIGKPVNITRAVETNTYLTPVQPSVFSYNLSGSNIAGMIEVMPDHLSYSATVDINPLGNVSGGNDFVYYAKGLKSFIDLEIPLSVIAANLTLVDTVAINIGTNLDNITEGDFRLTAVNGFPFSAALQFYTIGASGQITDSLLYHQKIIDAAQLNASYLVTQPKTSVLNIPVDYNKIVKLREANRVIVKARFNTASQSHHVRLYDYYKLSLNLTGDFNYIINTEN